MKAAFISTFDYSCENKEEIFASIRAMGGVIRYENEGEDTILVVDGEDVATLTCLGKRVVDAPTIYEDKDSGTWFPAWGDAP